MIRVENISFIKGKKNTNSTLIKSLRDISRYIKWNSNQHEIHKKRENLLPYSSHISLSLVASSVIYMKKPLSRLRFNIDYLLKSAICNNWPFSSLLLFWHEHDRRLPSHNLINSTSLLLLYSEKCFFHAIILPYRSQVKRAKKRVKPDASRSGHAILT